MVWPKIKSTARKHGGKFSLFVFIGILKTVFTIALNGALIDVLGISAFFGSSITAIIVFVGTYFAYVYSDVIKPKFIEYSVSTIGFIILQVVLISMMVYFGGLGGALSSAIVIAVLFVARYIFFRNIGMI